MCGSGVAFRFSFGLPTTNENHFQKTDRLGACVVNVIVYLLLRVRFEFGKRRRSCARRVFRRIALPAYGQEYFKKSRFVRVAVVLNRTLKKKKNNIF